MLYSVRDKEERSTFVVGGMVMYEILQEPVRRRQELQRQRARSMGRLELGNETARELRPQAQFAVIWVVEDDMLECQL